MNSGVVSKSLGKCVLGFLGMYLLMASSATWALESPFQLNYPYFEDDRYANNTGLAGKSFTEGFSFSGWFNFRKLPGDPRNLVGFDADSLVLASPGNGDVSLYFNQTEGAFLQVETDQWVNLAVAINDTDVGDPAIDPLFGPMTESTEWQTLMKALGKSKSQLDSIQFEVTLPR